MQQETGQAKSLQSFILGDMRKVTFSPAVYGCLALFLTAGSLFAGVQDATPHALTPPSLARNYAWPETYTNPLSLETSNGPAVSCPDPAIINETKNGHSTWYLYCTGDPLNSKDVNAQGQLINHLITQYQSYDLFEWRYIGDACHQTPVSVGTAASQLWAPAIKRFNSRFYLYFTAPNTLQGGPAIGVATSSSPGGPWTDSGKPVVAPENNPYNNAPGRAVSDPDEIQDASGQRYISYGG